MELDTSVSFLETCKPYINLWEKINHTTDITKEAFTYCIETIQLNGSLSDAMSQLRMHNRDFIFIHGISENLQRENYGLLCTGKPRQLADEDSCFFVGELINHEIKSSKNCAINFYQLMEFMGIDAKCRLGHIYLVDETEKNELILESFLTAICMQHEDKP